MPWISQRKLSELHMSNYKLMVAVKDSRDRVMARRKQTVYVVVAGSEIDGVFSTRAFAEEYIAGLPEMAPGEGSGRDIEEYVLNDSVCLGGENER